MRNALWNFFKSYENVCYSNRKQNASDLNVLCKNYEFEKGNNASLWQLIISNTETFWIINDNSSSLDYVLCTDVCSYRWYIKNFIRKLNIQLGVLDEYQSKYRNAIKIISYVVIGKKGRHMTI